MTIKVTTKKYHITVRDMITKFCKSCGSFQYVYQETKDSSICCARCSYIIVRGKD